MALKLRIPDTDLNSFKILFLQNPSYGYQANKIGIDLKNTSVGFACRFSQKYSACKYLMQSTEVNCSSS